MVFCYFIIVFVGIIIVTVGDDGLFLLCIRIPSAKSVRATRELLECLVALAQHVAQPNHGDIVVLRFKFKTTSLKRIKNLSRFCRTVSTLCLAHLKILPSSCRQGKSSAKAVEIPLPPSSSTIRGNV